MQLQLVNMQLAPSIVFSYLYCSCEQIYILTCTYVCTMYVKMLLDCKQHVYIAIWGFQSLFEQEIEQLISYMHPIRYIPQYIHVATFIFMYIHSRHVQVFTIITVIKFTISHAYLTYINYVHIKLYAQLHSQLFMNLKQWLHVQTTSCSFHSQCAYIRYVVSYLSACTFISASYMHTMLFSSP